MLSTRKRSRISIASPSGAWRVVVLPFLLLLCLTSKCLSFRMLELSRNRFSTLTQQNMVMTPPSSSDIRKKSFDFRKQKVRTKYKRKRIPESERVLRNLQRARQEQYEKLALRHDNSNNKDHPLWSFESLFPEPVWDEKAVKRDLYEVKKRDVKTESTRLQTHASKDAAALQSREKMKSSFYGGTSMLRIWREPKLSSAYCSFEESKSSKKNPVGQIIKDILTTRTDNANMTTIPQKVDRDLTRMVEDRMYGYRRTQRGEFQYETSLMGDGAVKFRDGVRLGNPLRINADRLNYMAKKELQHGRVEEAQELFECAIRIDPRDGRAYLGLSRCAQRRQDYTLARECLQTGIANSVSTNTQGDVDRGANPFLLQALGFLEEKMGNLAEAEGLYIAAARSRPSHAAAWVALAQLRTRKLGQSVSAGRACFQAAERELKLAGLPPSSHVYTAWASLEYHGASDVRRARELFNAALKVDPKCSAALLQLGAMEADCQNWAEAQKCFETVLKFDQRNSRVLQAYAIMETKRPDGNSRKAIGLFERALKTNPRDAGVFQAYAMYVAELGDVDSARDLLRRGTEANKRHAPVWQAWGVMEARSGDPEMARKIFQQGIWACAQLSGGQSGGYACARLWQAWGVMEAEQDNYAAARRCFSRALDADSRNVAAITAWALMEEELGNIRDARSVFERALRKFAAGSDEKKAIWRNYELMEQRTGQPVAAQQVYQRAMRESMIRDETEEEEEALRPREPARSENTGSKPSEPNNEVEVVRWNGGGEVWLNDRAIEGKVPFNMKSRNSKK